MLIEQSEEEVLEFFLFLCSICNITHKIKMSIGKKKIHTIFTKRKKRKSSIKEILFPIFSENII